MMSRMIQYQEENDLFCFIANYHALTTIPDKSTLSDNTFNAACDFLALGLDPDKSTFWIQSDVPEVTELTWILASHASVGLMDRATSYKDKIARGLSPNMGLYSYPILMAADILLYKATHVPVGADQKQHLELTRDIAQRFNNTYSPTFKVPEPFIPKAGARIMSLQDVEKKMSKSDANENNYISLLDPPDVLQRKIKRAVTDSAREITPSSADQPGIGNLLTIYSVLNDMELNAVGSRFEGQQYSGFKGDLADSLVAFLEPFQERYDQIMGDKAYLSGILDEGAHRARKLAIKTMSKVYRKVGFVPVGRSK